MKKLIFKPTKKQYLAFQKLMDWTTRYILFGGGAGGGKSYLLVAWIVTMALNYPQTKWFIGRKELKRLMSSTYITFLKFCQDYGIPRDSWKLNGQYNYIEFVNGSRIDLLDVDYKPSDPLFERFGSMEFTGGAIEEVGEVCFDAYDTLKSRINRHLNDHYKIPAKLLMTCNPKRHWAYFDFYRPWTKGELDKDYCFIQSLYNDNPYTAGSYGETLATIKNKAKRQRLMLGDWEYEDDPSALIDTDKINDLFTTSPRIARAKYITCDVARFGGDFTVIFLWQGLHLVKAMFMEKSSTREVRLKLEEWAKKFNVPRSNIIVDEDGVGGGVKDEMQGIKGFVNNSSPVRTKKQREKKEENYSNLKTQCYYRLADFINLGRMSIGKVEEKIKQGLVEDLSMVKSDNVDNDEIQKLIKKEEVKKVLGRSPDFSDALMIRMYFELSHIDYTGRAG